MSFSTEEILEELASASGWQVRMERGESRLTRLPRDERQRALHAESMRRARATPEGKRKNREAARRWRAEHLEEERARDRARYARKKAKERTQ